RVACEAYPVTGKMHAVDVPGGAGVIHPGSQLELIACLVDSLAFKQVGRDVAGSACRHAGTIGSCTFRATHPAQDAGPPGVGLPGKLRDDALGVVVVGDVVPAVDDISGEGKLIGKWRGQAHA